LKGPTSRKKASKRLLVAPSQKVTSFVYQELTNTLGRRFFRGPQILKKKATKRLRVAPSQKSGQSYQQLTYWEAAFVEGTNSRKKASKRPLVAPSQKVSSFISKSHIGKPYFEGPQFPKKAWKRHPGRPREARPRKAQRGPERPRDAERGQNEPGTRESLHRSQPASQSAGPFGSLFRDLGPFKKAAPNM